MIKPKIVYVNEYDSNISPQLKSNISKSANLKNPIVVFIRRRINHRLLIYLLIFITLLLELFNLYLMNRVIKYLIILNHFSLSYIFFIDLFIRWCRSLYRLKRVYSCSN
jgi:hypothetical protein